MRTFMQHNWCIGSCKIFRKSCLCASAPPRANRKRGILSRAPSMDNQRGSLPCCGSEGVPADGILSDSVPLEVVLEFRLLSPIWGCTRGDRQGQTLPSSHMNFVQMRPLQRYHVPWLVPASRYSAVDANLSPHLAICSAVSMTWWELPSMLSQLWTLHPLSQLWALYFCSLLGVLNFFQCLHCWRSVNTGPEQVTFFAWQTLPQQALTGCFADRKSVV